MKGTPAVTGKYRSAEVKKKLFELWAAETGAEWASGSQLTVSARLGRQQQIHSLHRTGRQQRKGEVNSYTHTHTHTRLKTEGGGVSVGDEGKRGSLHAAHQRG